MRKQYIFLFMIIFLLTACGTESRRRSAGTNGSMVGESAVSEVEMHSLYVEGTHVTFIFDGDKTLLLDFSSSPDEGLIEAYLKAQGLSAFDCIIYAKRPQTIGLPLSASGAVYAPAEENEAGTIIQAALPGQGFAVNNTRIDFTEDEEKLKVELTYLGCRYMYTLETWPPSETTREKAVVDIQQPAPDGSNTRIEYKPLREVLEQ